jgi:tRNA (guanine37-N1)-methyltransferase
MSLRHDCEGCVPPHLIPLVPARFDIIGDIAVLGLPSPVLPYSGAIVATILRRNKTIRTVVNKTGKTGGEGRTARYDLICGGPTTTLHRESGFMYRLDIQEVFFAPRLAAERRRVAGLVQPGEAVLVPFAGIGPFAVPAAARGGAVTAVEKSPSAYRWLMENAVNNSVADRMILINGDAYDLSLLPRRDYDRAIVPAPYGQEMVVEPISTVVRPGGTIHLYLFKKKCQLPYLLGSLADNGLTALRCKRCGNVAPGVNRWVLDLEKTSGQGGGPERCVRDVPGFPFSG